MSSSSKKNDGSPAAEHNAPKPHAGGGPARSGCAHHAPSRNAPALQARGPHKGCAHVVTYEILALCRSFLDGC